jgi:uncharacterized protein YndB with AHSA1/START domain
MRGIDAGCPPGYRAPGFREMLQQFARPAAPLRPARRLAGDDQEGAMKWIKRIAVVIGLLIGVVVIGGWFISPTFTVSRSVTVAAPADKVFALLVDPREWKRWTVWNRRDPGMEITYSGPPSGVGAGWAWTSASEGSGRMTFTAVQPTQGITYELFFPDFGTTSTGDLRLAPEGAGTRVTWTMNGNMGSNPVFRWMTLAMDGMVGQDFEAGLANLKALAEQP